MAIEKDGMFKCQLGNFRQTVAVFSFGFSAALVCAPRSGVVEGEQYGCQLLFVDDGGVQFALLDDNGNEIAIDVVNGKPVDDSFDLSVIKFYYRAANDTTTYYSTNPRLYMQSGTYTVGAQAQCYMGGAGEGAFRTLDTNCQVTIYGSYTVPEIFVLANIATSSRSSGNRPTLPCGATGRIQLKITGGSFPYTVKLFDAHSSTLVREVVFTSRQSSGIDPNMANYRDYYTIDDLEAGDYHIEFTDACDFQSTASSLSWTVEDVNPPMLTDAYMYTYNWDNLSSYNTIRFYQAYFTEGDMADYLQDMYAEHLQYRVCYGTVDTSDWKPFPLQNLRQRNDKTYELNEHFFDSAPHVTKYCQLNNQILTLQFRNNFCNQDTIINRYTGKFKTSDGDDSYSMWYSYQHAEDVDYSGTWYDSCTYHIPSVRDYTDYYYQYWNGYTYSLISENHPNNVWYSSFATAPYTFVMTDTRDNREIKRETMGNRNAFTVYKSDFEGVYGEISDTTIDIPVKVVMTDAKGCQWTNTYTVSIRDNTDTLDGNFYLSSYSYYYSEAQYCCQEPSYFQIYERSSSDGTTPHLPNPIPALFKQTRDGAQFKCVRSPRGNKYNFTATYDYGTDSWTVVKDSVTNNAEITPYIIDEQNQYRWGLQVSDYCLPQGYYEFEYTTDCRTQNYRIWHGGTERRFVYTEPSFSFDQECDNYYINLTGGQFQRQQIGTNTNLSTQPEQISNTENLNTYFRIVDGPQGGYPTADYRVGSTIRLSSPGTYTLRMFTPDTTYYCRAPYFDTTFSYTGGSVSFDYAVSYVCDVDSTVGYIYSQAKDGMAPYVYTLYSQPAMGGQVIASNDNGSFRGIPNIRVGDILSLQVEDACGRSFYLDMTVSDLAQSQLAWFDGALRVTQTCEGSEIDVYVSSLDENFTYHWTGPDGFETTTARGHIFVERGASSGYYAVELGNTGCSASLKDSVELSVIQSPKVAISDGVAVCPGESVQLSFTPEYGNGRVSYTIGKEVNSEVTFYNYNGNVGQTQNQTYIANSEAKYWIHSVSDNLCTYSIPEDTIKILLRNTSNSCDVTVSEDAICYGTDAQVTATSTTMLTPYMVRWYDDANQNNLLMEEEMTSDGQASTYYTNALYENKSLYVTVQDAVHCEPQVGTIHSWINMGNTTSTLSCGESMRFFDDGGVSGNYSGNANLRHVFTSDGNNAITLSFNSFNTQSGADVIRVYTGNTVNQDSLLGSFSGTSMPATLTSKSNTMTVVFTSNGYIDAPGWDAVVSCSALPAEVAISVTEPLSVSLTPSPELPARYNNDITLTATAAGARGEQYRYQWYVAEPNMPEELKQDEITSSTTNSYNITPILSSQNVRVVVSDASTNACAETAEESIYLEIADIEMTMSLYSQVSEMCQGELSVDVTVNNAGGETASNVKAKLNLPTGMRFSNVADTLISLGNIDAGSSVSTTINLVNEGHYTEVTRDSIKAQIWSCDQGDAVSSYRNWNWNGMPTEQDEAFYEVIIRPSVDIVTANSVTINTENICYESDAHFEAVNTAMDAPLTYNWYADAALTQLIKSETLYDNTAPSSLDLQGVTEITPAYLTVTNDNYCPAYGTVAYTVKQNYPVTGTVLMCDGAMTINNDDHIMFYDDGGPNNNYTANKNYTYLFSSTDGSPVVIAFENSGYITSDNNIGKLLIYDGDNDLTPRLAMYRWSDMRGKVLTAHTGKMLVIFESNNNTHNGFSAHVFTSARLFAKEAKVVFKNSISDATITTTGAELCPGEVATLTASSDITTPQYYTWYSQDRFSVLKRDTVTQGNTSTIMVTPTEEAPYFVSVSNDDNCSQSASPYTNYREVLMNGSNGSSTSYNLAANDMIGFFDAGGPSGNYEPGIGYTYYFYPPEGSHIHLHINSMELGDNGWFYVYKRIGNNDYTLAELRGSQTNLDFEIDDNYLRVYFWAENRETYAGWDARIYAVAPQDSTALARAEIHFKPYQSPDSILVSTTPICYGEETTLTATSNDTHYPQYYTWYNPDRTAILKQETVTEGNVSTLTIVPQSAAYWVGMATEATCPIMPTVHSDYREVLMNGQGNVYSLSASDSIGFFDAGGRNGNFEPDRGYDYYFYAPEGSRIHFHINTLNIGDCASMDLYNRNYRLAQVRGSKSNVDFVTDENYLHVYFYGCSSTYPGWDAYIYAETSQDASVLAKAEVQFKPSMESGLIEANNPAVCYGEDVEVTASSNVNSTQYYKWYDSDLNLLQEETVPVGGNSTLSLSNVTSHTYYVAMHSDNTCPINMRESVLLNSATHNQTTVVRQGQAIAFYDDGGLTGDYTTGSQKRHTFVAENGQVSLHFSSFEAYNGYMYIYDGGAYDNYQIGDLSGTITNRNYISTTGSLTVVWESNNADPRAGWEALVSVQEESHNNTTTILLDASQDHQRTYIAPDAGVVFYDDGGYNDSRSSNGTYEHTFTALEGSVRIQFNQVGLCSDDRIYIYDGETASNENLIRQFYQRPPQAITSSGSSLTVRFVPTQNCCCPSGWEAFISTVSPQNEMKKIDITYKKPVKVDAAYSLTPEICYGGSATFVAQSSIAYPQYYAWYDENLSLLQQDVVQAGQDTLVLDRVVNNNYYVSIYNDQECPVIVENNKIQNISSEFDISTLPAGGTDRLLLESSENGQVTVLGPGDAVEFYDEGGATGDYYTSNVNWMHTFKAVGGHVALHFYTFSSEECCDYMRIYDGQSTSGTLLDELRGNISDVTYFAESGYLTIQWYTNGGSAVSSGWDAIVAGTDFVMEQVAVSFQQPASPSVITTMGETVCYGSVATLRAQANIDYPQYYTWFSPDRREIIARDTVWQSGEMSELTLLPRTASTYYVAVSNDNTCPINPDLHLSYHEILMGVGDNSYILSANDSIGFFDMGGKNGNYIGDENSYQYYFYASEGSYIRIHINEMQLGNGYMYFYNRNGNSIAYFSGTRSDEDFVIADNYLRIRFYTSNEPAMGWDSYVYAITPQDANALASVSVSLNRAGSNSAVTTQSDVVCYGGEAVLKASAENLTTPQYFNWYDERLNLVHKDTVFTAGDSSRCVINPVAAAQTYYVSTGNAENCPVILAEKTVLLNSNTNEQTTIVRPGQPVAFYDDGGPDGDYSSTNGEWWSHTFVAESGQLILRFSDFEGQNDDWNDYMYIYDEGTNSTSHLATMSQRSSEIDRTFTSTSGRLRVQWYTNGSGRGPGWRATVEVLSGDNADVPIVLLNEANNQGQTMVAPDQVVYFYDEGGRNNSYSNNHNSAYSYTHTFTALQGNVSVSFPSCLSISSNDILYAYDGSSVNAPLLGEWRGSNCEYPRITSTGNSITFRLESPANSCCYSGWRAVVSSVNAQNDMAQAEVSVKVASPNSIATIGDTVCYGGSATLKATSEIGYPQYYTWFSPDRMNIIYRDTIQNGDTSRFTVGSVTTPTYYVAVSNDTTCPIVMGLHPNYREVLMNCSYGEQTYNLAVGDSIGFFDNGGKDDNYRANQNSCEYYFYAEEGSLIHFHIDTIAFGSNAYMYLYNRNGNQIAYINTNRGNLDYLVNDNYLRVYFYEGNSPAMGWNAYLYANTPQDESSLAKATVSFRTPLSSEHVSTAGDQVCYGTEAQLSATADIAYPQYFTWYDENMNVKQRDTLYQVSDTSTYRVENVYVDQAYYVTVGNDTACTLSLSGEMLLLNSNSDGQTTLVTKGKSIAFYDDGGPNGNYTPGTSYTHTFTADSGQVMMTVSSFYSNGGCDMLYIYDGLTASGNSIGSITSQASNASTYTSTTGSLTVRWNSSCSTPNYPGWEATVKIADGQSNSYMQTVILDENAHQQVTTVLPSASIAFYDDGGPNDRHGSNVDYMHTFTAMFGAVSIQFIDLSFCNGNMYFYEGDTIDESRLIATFNNNTNSNNRKVTSTGRSMTVRFVSQNCCCASGWKAMVSAVNMQNEMAEAEAKVKYTSRGDITAKGDTICYGSEASLTASSSLSTPQYYTWFSPDLSEIVQRDTVRNDGEVSTYHVQTEEETRYYVAVTCDTTCPLVTPVRYNYRVVTTSSSSSASTFTVKPADSLVFYDEGGPDGLFSYGYKYYYFYGADGAQLHLHFDTVCLGDHGATMTIYTRQGNTRTLANLTGNHGALDYVSDDNYLYVYFYNNNLSLFDGWKGYVVTTISQDTGAVVMVPVRFQRPEINHNIQLTDVVACYGEDVVLSAKMDEDSIAYPQNFAWYDKDFNLLKQEVINADSSTLTVAALSNTIYYVNVTAGDECPVLPPNNDVLLNSTTHDKTTVISAGQILNFYDDGGPNGDYSYTSNNITHTFRAESGQVSMTMKAFESYEGCDILEIYDGPSTNGNRIREFRGTYSNINETLTSTTGSLTVSWGTHCGTYNYSGWKAEVSVTGTGSSAESIVFDSVHVSLMDPTINTTLTVVDAAVCYGDSATLTATSDMPGTLNFAWYDEYQNLLKTESSTTGSSSLKVLAYRDQNYYVNVASDMECASIPAIPSPKQISTVLMDYSNNNRTTTLQPTDSIRFFDSGGQSSSYGGNTSIYTHTFTASGKLKVEFFTNNSDMASNDTLYIYDADHVDADHLLGIRVQSNSSMNNAYVSTGNYLTFRLSTHGNCCYNGWNSSIYMITQDYPLVEAHVTLKPFGTSAQVTAVNDTVCYGSEATLKVTSEAGYPQYYTWYGPDRYTIVHRDTLTSAGYSSYTYVPTEEECHYVLVNDNSSCPVVEPLLSNLRSINMPDNTTTYEIAPGDSIRFYDSGGPNAPYGMYRSWYANFTAEEGSYIRIHFDTLDLNTSNNSCQMQISDSRGTVIATLDGHKANLDYLIADNYVRFYFYSYTSTIFSGWESYLYAVKLPEEDDLAKPRVAFKTPVISDRINVEDVEACYGTEAVLTATTSIPAPQHFAWYDNDYNLLKEELVTSGSSNLDVLVVTDTIYHVNVCAENECSVLPPSMIPVKNLLLKADASGKTTHIHPHKIIGFYDEGGPDGNYSTYQANWTHTFTADSGQVVIHFTNFASSGGCDRIYIYDGTTTTGESIGYFTSTYSGLDQSFTSTNGSLTVHWRTECSGSNYAGWNATVFVAGAEDNTYNELNMSSAQVRVKPIVPAAHITTTNDTVCFGTETTLTAVSDIAYPQYYTWFDEDRMTVLQRDTVIQAGENSAFVVTPIIDKTYYVAVATDSTCAVIPVDNLELKDATVKLKKSQLLTGIVTTGDTACYGQSVTLSANNPGMAYPQNYLWFDANMTLLKSEQITNGNSTLEIDPLTSTQNYYVTVGNETVCPLGARHEILWLDASAHNKTTPVGIGTVIELYDEGGPSGTYHTYNSNWQHTFTADTGQVVLNLTEYASSCGCDQLTIYDGTSTNGPSMASWTCTQSNLNVSYTSTTGSLTVHWRQQCSGSNYAGFAATVKNSIEVTDLIASATASVKEPSNSLPLTAVPDMTCEGTEAMLSASSTIDKPQYYAWYAPDKTL